MVVWNVIELSDNDNDEHIILAAKGRNHWRPRTPSLRSFPGPHPLAPLQPEDRARLPGVDSALHPIPRPPAPAHPGAGPHHGVPLVARDRPPRVGFDPEPGACSPPLPLPGGPCHGVALAKGDLSRQAAAPASRRAHASGSPCTSRPNA